MIALSAQRRDGDLSYLRSRSKAEMCSTIGASVLIDDSMDYAEELASIQRHCVLFDLDGTYGSDRREGIQKFTSFSQATRP